MKILCVCQRGNCRSVALGYLLKDYHGIEAIAIGWQTAGPESKAFLFSWADRIVVLQPEMRQHVPEEYQGKTLVFNVGPDTYGHARNPQLLNKLEDFITKAKSNEWSVS